MESRPHVTFLHGQPGAGADWNGVTALLPHVDAFTPDRPGYRDNPASPGGFVHNADDVLAHLDAAAVDETVLVAHSFGGGAALALAARAPERVRGLVLLASVGPGCLTGWDHLLAAPVAGPVCAVCAWRLTPWAARARLARIARRRGRPLAHDEHVNWDVWAQARHHSGAMWRTFLVEQRALVAELDLLADAAREIRCPVLLLADPGDTMVPFATSQTLAHLLPNARLQPVPGVGHHLPRRAAPVVAAAVGDLLDQLSPARTR